MTNDEKNPNERGMVGESMMAFQGGADVNPVTIMKKENDNCATCNYVISIVLEQVNDLSKKYTAWLILMLCYGMYHASTTMFPFYRCETQIIKMRFET